jgi:3-oxoacyl-[acyl-carrier-protein] synthase-1
MPVFAIADNIFSPLGFTTEENFGQLLAGASGIRQHELPAIHKLGFYASLIPEVPTIEGSDFTRFELMIIHSIADALRNTSVYITDTSTGIIISTTKGNISLLESEYSSSGENVYSHASVDKHDAYRHASVRKRLPLHYSAQQIASYFSNPNQPVVVSNACISGLTALITAKRMIEAGIYKNVVVAGADTISSFVFSGFNAFQAISSQPCKPYDIARNGVTLGEAAGTIILSDNPGKEGIQLAGGGASNDANHISGPSRTGEELNMAMQKAMAEAGLKAADIDFISAHGTATVYNDEMESKAITLAGLQNVPVNSLKGYFGHTLGAAGIIESVIALQTMKSNTVLPTKGFEELGVPMPINVIDKTFSLEVNSCLKTASGFGGCNAAVVWTRMRG